MLLFSSCSGEEKGTIIIIINIMVQIKGVFSSSPPLRIEAHCACTVYYFLIGDRFQSHDPTAELSATMGGKSHSLNENFAGELGQF